MSRGQADLPYRHLRIQPQRIGLGGATGDDGLTPGAPRDRTTDSVEGGQEPKRTLKGHTRTPLATLSSFPFRAKRDGVLSIAAREPRCMKSSGDRRLPSGTNSAEERMQRVWRLATLSEVSFDF